MNIIETTNTINKTKLLLNYIASTDNQTIVSEIINNLSKIESMVQSNTITTTTETDTILFKLDKIIPLNDLIRMYIDEALAKNDNNITITAKQLNVTRNLVYRRTI